MQEDDLKPTIILPETAPLIHLAAGGALHVLNALGRVVVVDIVMLEATFYPASMRSFINPVKT